MKKLSLISLLAVTIFCVNVTAQTTITDPVRVKALTKEHAAQMKQLKKQHNLWKITIELEENDGWHYLVTSNEKKSRGWEGIISRDGNVVIAPAYFNLHYVPALKEGTSSFKAGYNGEYEVEIWHPARPAHYVGYASHMKKHSGFEYNGVELTRNIGSTVFISTDGTVLNETDYMITPIPGYYAVGVRSISAHDRGSFSISDFRSDKKMFVGLMTSTGDMLLQPEYHSIQVVFEKTAYTSKWDEGANIRNGCMLLTDPSVVVPAIFAEVTHKSDGTWMVKRTSNSPAEVWQPNLTPDQIYRDEGERLYENWKSEEVIQYYASEGVGAPWAKFFTGASLCRLANIKLAGISNFRNQVNIGQTAIDIPQIDFQTTYNQLNMGINLLQLYKETDTFYAAKADEIIADTRETMDKLEQGHYQQELSSLINQLEQNKAEAYNRYVVQQQQQQQQLQQAAAFMNTLLNNIQSGMNKSSNLQRSNVRHSNTTSIGISNSSNTEESSSSAKKVVEKHNTCSTCHGNKKCSVCKGSGKSKATYRDGSPKQCDACSGSGECFICDGKGYKVRYEYE